MPNAREGYELLGANVICQRSEMIACKVDPHLLCQLSGCMCAMSWNKQDLLLSVYSAPNKNASCSLQSTLFCMPTLTEGKPAKNFRPKLMSSQGSSSPHNICTGTDLEAMAVSRSSGSCKKSNRGEKASILVYKQLVTLPVQRRQVTVLCSYRGRSSECMKLTGPPE